MYMHKLKEFFRSQATVLIIFAIQLTLFRDLLQNIFTNLIDWRDYALLVWILGGIKNNVLQGNIQTFFDGNIYFPSNFTLLFSDSFYPQFLAFLPAFIVSGSHIFAFNTVFFLTLALNTLGASSLWKSLQIKQPLLLFFATLVTSLSPFFFSELSHFQMISFWPLLFALSFLFKLKEKTTGKNIVLIILFTSIQFYASVYLFTYLITLIGVFFAIEFFFAEKKERLTTLITVSKIVLGIGVAVVPFYVLYYFIQHTYQADRQYFEYVLYAAHFTDYFFPNSWSTLSKFTPIAAFSSLNKHFVGEPALFPGFVLSSLGLYGLIKTFNRRNKTYIFFVLLLCIGFVFSLGPKLNINGTFIDFPLPYALPLKLVPFYWPLRATKRWSFLLYTSLAYFSVFGLKAILKESPKKFFVVIVLAIGVYALEMLPLQYRSEYQNYYPNIYTIIENECRENPKVLLEYPMEENHAEANVATNLSYKTTFMVSSLTHGCNLINGYSGLVPPTSTAFQNNLSASVNNRDAENLSALLSEYSVSLVKINELRVSPEDKQNILSTLNSVPEFKLVVQDASSKIYIRTNE